MRLVQTRTKHNAQFFREQIAEVGLDMMLIPGGEFMMGSPEEEIVGASLGDSPHRFSNESPQHPVTVPDFYMGKYPITQAQWRAVVNDKSVDSDLNPEPAHFKGDAASPRDNHPVEQVSWFEATKFCTKLSQLTGRKYRLPSEAEWEYACRAGDKKNNPFHFGPTITTDLANYRGTDSEEYKWSGSYGDGPKGIYREETTPVEMFSPNAFGLYDMHGNVWEWCQDHWHDNYTGAPADGSAWIDSDAEEKAPRMLRGGCWFVNPCYCRSACRFSYNDPDLHSNDIGFRVVSEAARTL
jgi:formylglycine-generating enzyme required for sulfatase activity